MAAFQNTVQDLTARLKGSGILEIAPYSAGTVAALVASTGDGDAIGTWVNVGSIESLKVKEDMVSTILEGDNAEEEAYVSKHTVTISFNQREAMRAAIRAVLRGSFDVSGTPVAAAIVNGASQAVGSGAWAYNTFIPIANQNGDGSIIAITSVTGATDGALVADTDYALLKDDDGIYGIIIMDSATVTTLAQVVTIVYAYTPYASKTFYTGGKSSLPYFMARITNLDENDLMVRHWFWKCSIDSGYDFSYKKDMDADPIVSTPVSISVRIDNSIATKGKQLYSWYQEPGIA